MSVFGQVSEPTYRLNPATRVAISHLYVSVTMQ
jgi:hypothetical protein